MLIRTRARSDHHRAVDTLGMMLANGTITQEMYDAGTKFRMLFRSASLGTMGTSALVRLPGKTANGMSDHHVFAGLKVADAINVLGGHDSAAGSCAWHVLGCETSVREWAMRQGWGGRIVPPTQAQGMLVATLSVLASAFWADLAATSGMMRAFWAKKNARNVAERKGAKECRIAERNPLG